MSRQRRSAPPSGAMQRLQVARAHSSGSRSGLKTRVGPSAEDAMRERSWTLRQLNRRPLRAIPPPDFQTRRQMSDVMLHQDFETATPHNVRRLQEELWATQWSYVRASSVFYRGKYHGYNLENLDLNGIRDLPLTDKEELRLSQEISYPFGEYIT